MPRQFTCLGAISLVILLLGLSPLASGSTAAQTAPARAAGGAKAVASFPIAVTDSAKDIEILIAKLLKDTFNLESSLKIVNGDPDNLRLQIVMSEDKTQSIPRIVSIVDTAVVARDKAGNAISQTIPVAAMADLNFTETKMPALLQWVNDWNARMYPIRVFIANKQIYTGTSILGTTTEPTSSDRVVGSFLGVVRTWNAVLQDLRAKKLLPDTKPARQ